MLIKIEFIFGFSLITGNSHAYAEINSEKDGLGVTSREVVGVFLKQFWFKFVPVFHGLQGGSALKNRLRELLIIKQYITVHRRIKVFP